MSLRGLVLVGALFGPSVAFADRSFELATGVAVPIAEDDWARRADTSWKVAARATGEVAGRLGILGLEYARVRGFCHQLDRVRLMAGLAHQWSTEHVSVSTRIAIGPEFVICASKGGMQPLPADTITRYRHLGVGGEAAVTLWLIEGTSVDVGIEVGIPFGWHWRDGDSEGGNLKYVAVDLDVLLAIRVR